MFDRRLLQYFDWGLLALASIIGGIGLFTLYSAVTAETPEPQKIIFYKQLIWFSAALFAMTVSFSINYKLLDRWGQVLYIGCILLLVWVLFFGKYVGGSRRWLILGPVSVQPSELAKIAVMIVLARYYSKDANTRGHTLRELFRPAVLTLIPFFLIVRQPDLGTAGLLLLIAGSITLFVKIERRSLIYLMVSGAAVVPLVWFFKGISEATNPGFSGFGPGSAGSRVSYYPIQDCHRFGDDFRQRFFAGHSECLILSSRRAHRFYFFCSGGGMGFYWLGGPCPFVSAADILGPQHCPGMSRAVWYDSGRRNHLYDFLAGNYKYRHDHGLDAGGGYALAPGELWWIVGIDNRHRNRFINEC